MDEKRLALFRKKYTIDPEGCWIWHASKSGLPDWEVRYGLFYDGRRLVMAHKWSYETFVGPVPEGLVLDHTCRRSLCVNPEHLEPVTQKANLHRSPTFQALNAAKECCPAGHPYDEKNTRLKKSKGITRRVCRACEAEYDAARRAARRKERAPV